MTERSGRETPWPETEAELVGYLRATVRCVREAGVGASGVPALLACAAAGTLRYAAKATGASQDQVREALTLLQDQCGLVGPRPKSVLPENVYLMGMRVLDPPGSGGEGGRSGD